MTEKVYENLEQLWKKWEEACGRHPALQERFHFIRPLLHGLQMESKLSSAKRGFRFLLAAHLATIGIEKEKSACGWLGPSVQQMISYFSAAMEKILRPVTLGEKELIHGLVSMTTLAVVWAVAAALEPPWGWKRRVDPKTWEEIDKEMHVYGLLFLAGNGIGKQIFQAMAEVMEKTEKQQRQAGVLGWAYTLGLGIVVAQMQDEEVFIRCFSGLQKELSRAAEWIKESYEEEWLQEERQSLLGREWGSALQMLKLACDKGDVTTFSHLRDTLFSLTEAKQQTFREDLLDLRKTMKTMNDVLSLAVSTREDVVTGIIQTA